MIRPEAKDQLMRWREALTGGALLLLGLWWLAGPGQLLTIPAIVMIIAGLALIRIGFQRARFRSAGAGPGSVRVDEGQVAYFGPLTGGVIALGELQALSLDRRQHPAHWRLKQPGQNELMIPVNAEGAEALFDAFATLPGLKTARMLDALNGRAESGGEQQVVIWHRDLSAHAQLTVH